MGENRFHWADYLVFAFLLLISAGVGVFYGFKDRKQTTAEEFLVGGRNMKVLPVSVSLFVSYMSAIAFLGDPVEVYFFGGTYIFMALGFTLCIPVVAHIFAPFYHRMNLISAFEYLETRYNRVLRRLCSVIQIVTVLLWMGVVLYAPALALSQASGMPVWIAIVSVGGICTFYTTLGGIKAEVWADTIQMVIMAIGLIILVVRATYILGGMSKVGELAAAGGRMTFANFNPSPFIHATSWTYLFGGFFRTMVPYVALQLCIQKYCTLPTTRAVSMAVYLTLPMYGFCIILFYLIGILMFVYYHGCDPLKSGRITAPDQMVPLFVLDVLGVLPGLPGLFMACIFSASLSTVASGLNALAANILSDIIQPFYKKRKGVEFPARLGATICKCIAVGMGTLTIALAFLIMAIGSSVFVITTKLAGMMGGPTLGIFIMGILWPMSNTAGAVAGFVGSLIICNWLGIGAMFFRHKPQILPLSISDCPAADIISNVTTTLNMTMSRVTTVEPQVVPIDVDEGSGIGKIYRLSPILYPALGTLATVAIGMLVSFIMYRYQLRNGQPTYKDLQKEVHVPTYQDMKQEKLNDKKLKKLKKGRLVEKSVQFPSANCIFHDNNNHLVYTGSGLGEDEDGLLSGEENNDESWRAEQEAAWKKMKESML